MSTANKIPPSLQLVYHLGCLPFIQEVFIKPPCSYSYNDNPVHIYVYYSDLFSVYFSIHYITMQNDIV